MTTKSIFSREHCNAISKGLTGRKLTEEHKAKMREAWKRRKEMQKKAVTTDVG